MTKNSLSAFSRIKYDISEDISLLSSLLYWNQKEPNRTMFLVHEGTEWIPVSNQQFFEEVLQIVRGLDQLGIKPGDRIGIMSSTRYEWSLVDYAIMFSKAISVPIYPTDSLSQVKWIIKDTNVKICFVETKKQYKLFTSQTDLKDCKFILFENNHKKDDLEYLKSVAIESNIFKDDLTKVADKTKASNVVTIVHTSGTSGNPKGCCLTHRNFLSASRFAINSSLNYIMTEPDSKNLIFLPLAHVLARSLVYSYIESGTYLGLTNDLENLVPLLASFKPTHLASVPRVFEKIFSTISLEANSGLKKQIFNSAVNTAVKYDKASLSIDKPISTALKTKHKIFDKLVYKKIRDAIGGECKSVCLGGSPISTKLVHFFSGAGIPLHEGYGLTESTSSITLNTPGQTKVGTCGKIADGNAIKIAPDGEILLKGDNIFKEYWNKPEETAASFEDGWYKTGDLGKLDNEGYLTITGRKKDIIITAGGKNVSPAGLENIIVQHPLVEHSVVVGDKKPFVSALITIDPDGLEKWKQANNIKTEVSLEELITNEKLIKEIQTSIDKANETVSRAESIKKFIIMTNQFTEEGGELTPSLKIKRRIIDDKYKNTINSLYN